MICEMHFKRRNRDRPAAVDGAVAAATEGEASQLTPDEDSEAALPGPPPGPPPLSVTTQQNTLASPGDFPEDTLPPPPPLTQLEAEAPGSAPEAGAVDDKWGAGSGDDKWGAGAADDKWA